MRGNGGPSVEVDWPRLETIIGDFLSANGLEAYTDVRVAVSFVDEGEIRSLNASYRALDEATDVLSFPMWEERGCFSPPGDWDDLSLGDVIVCPSYVMHDARNRNIIYNDAIVLMVIHGILHLIGFDHDTEERTRRMWTEQERLQKLYGRDDRMERGR